MPTYEFKCVEGGEVQTFKLSVSAYTQLIKGKLTCLEHVTSPMKRVFSTFSFRM